MEEVRKNERKPGRTLLISNDHQDELNVDGIMNTHITDSGSRFVVFDTIENAQQAFDQLTNEGVKVKYSYYKLFFRLRDMNLENTTYDEIKNEIKTRLSQLDDVNIVYFKLYTKNRELIGSGDLTVDCKDALDTLVNTREIELNNGSMSVYRYKFRKSEYQGSPM